MRRHGKFHPFGKESVLLQSKHKHELVEVGPPVVLEGVVVTYGTLLVVPLDEVITGVVMVEDRVVEG